MPGLQVQQSSSTPSPGSAAQAFQRKLSSSRWGLTLPASGGIYIRTIVRSSPAAYPGLLWLPRGDSESCLGQECHYCENQLPPPRALHRVMWEARLSSVLTICRVAQLGPFAPSPQPPIPKYATGRSGSGPATRRTRHSSVLCNKAATGPT